MCRASASHREGVASAGRPSACAYTSASWAARRPSRSRRAGGVRRPARPRGQTQAPAQRARAAGGARGRASRLAANGAGRRPARRERAQARPTSASRRVDGVEDLGRRRVVGGAEARAGERRHRRSSAAAFSSARPAVTSGSQARRSRRGAAVSLPMLGEAVVGVQRDAPGDAQLEPAAGVASELDVALAGRHAPRRQLRGLGDEAADQGIVEGRGAREDEALVAQRLLARDARPGSRAAAVRYGRSRAWSSRVSVYLSRTARPQQAQPLASPRASPGTAPGAGPASAACRAGPGGQVGDVGDGVR